MKFRHHVKRIFQVFRQKTAFSALSSNIDFSKNILNKTSCLSPPAYLKRKWHAVHRLNKRYLSGDIFYFITLKCTDEMPFYRFVKMDLLVKKFLNTVFTDTFKSE